MKWIKNIALPLLSAFSMLAIASCEKEETTPYYDYGKPVQLTSSATTLTTPPSDSNTVVLTLNWTDPKYNNVAGTNKYIVQIDSAGRNFSKPVTRELSNLNEIKFRGKDINSFLLDSLGFVINKAGTLEMRVISSFANNNQRLNSNVIKLTVTPYKIPPRVTLPSSGRLFIIGDATDAGWVNPVPTPAFEFTRIDETTFGGIFYLYAGAQYLILPVNGSWDNKYSVAQNTLPNLNQGGDFGYNLKDNFPGPREDGLYKIMLDFQTGKFTVTPFTQQHGLPSSLVAVGGATPGDWANEAGNTQKFTRLNSTKWEITINLKANNEYLILPEPGNWGKKYGVENNTIDAARLAGTLKPEGQNLRSPAEAGNYRITVDFINNSYKLTKL